MAPSIVRSWKARATPEGADAYVAFFRTRLQHELALLEGHRGALILRRAVDDAVEITVLTFWDSMDAVKRFAGEAIDRAVVEPEARAALDSYDESVTHLAVALDSR